MNKLSVQQSYDKKVLRVMIEIYCRKIHNSNTLCREKNGIKLYVEDTGIGIAKKIKVSYSIVLRS